MVEDVSANRIEKNVNDTSGKCPYIIRGGGKLSATSGNMMIHDAVMQDKMKCKFRGFEIQGDFAFSKNQDFVEKVLGRKGKTMDYMLKKNEDALAKESTDAPKPKPAKKQKKVKNVPKVLPKEAQIEIDQAKVKMDELLNKYGVNKE